MRAIEEFLREIDARWKPASTQSIPLRIIGAAALMLQSDYERATTDSDVLETADLDKDTQRQLLRLAGPESSLQKRHGMYIQIVRSGIPFLPQVPKWRTVISFKDLGHFEVLVLDVVDVVVSKLKRFHPRDEEHIAAMIDRGLVPHDVLVDRFGEAVEWFKLDARAEEVPRYCANLNRVERDLFGADETEFDLSWIR
jgi:hypothetical protein